MRNKSYLPWVKSWLGMRARCQDQKRETYKRIKSLISKEELKFIWFRDKGYLLKQPSLDRVNTTGDYTFNNCRYIELSENVRRPRSKTKVSINSSLSNLKISWERRKKPVVYRRELGGKIIGRFGSMKEACEKIGRVHQSINASIHSHWVCAGFYWDFEKSPALKGES